MKSLTKGYVKEKMLGSADLEEFKEWVEVDFHQPTREILTDEAITQSAIISTAPKDVDSDEGDVDEINNISGNQEADFLNTFIKFSELSNSFTDAKIIMGDDFLKKQKKGEYYKTRGYSKFVQDGFYE